MANVKLLLDTRRAKSNGNFNVIFRITDVKKVYTINSDISVHENHWDLQNLVVCNSHPNSKLLNLKLIKMYYKIQEALLKLGDDFTIEKLRNLVGGRSKDESKSIKSFADKIILQMMQNNKIGNSLVYQTAINSLIDFTGDSITFKQLDYNLLERFTSHLANKGLKQNSIHNYFRTIRAIYNKAIKHKIVDRSLYPFHDITIKSEITVKRAISKEDILKLRDLHLKEDSAPWRALNHFLLSFYLIGISFTDLAYLKHENIVNGRVVYRRRKTGKNYSVKLFPQAEAILFEYARSESKYLLPILHEDTPENTLKAKRIIMQWIKTTNKYLKRLSEQAKINTVVTTYVARHTFATTAKKLGCSNEIISEALGHEYGNKITNIYLDSFDKEIVDSMHQKVIES